MIQWSTIICALLDAKKSIQRSVSRASANSLKHSAPSHTNESKGSFSTYRSDVVQQSMIFLDMTLENSIESFLTWVAAHDFTAECVLFLMRVRNFRRSWRIKSCNGCLTTTNQRNLYLEAADIFFDLVEPCTSEIEVNISGSILDELRSVFYHPESATSEHSSTSSFNIVTPWDNCPSVHTQPRGVHMYDKKATRPWFRSEPVEEELLSSLDIPVGFSVKVFDKAYDMVKLDVYRGAWPHYLNKFGRMNHYE